MAFRTAMKNLVERAFVKIFGLGAVKTQVDEFLGTLGLFAGIRAERFTATPKNLTVADSGKLLLYAGAGAGTINLPAPAEGLCFLVANLVNQNLTVAGAAANQIVGFNNDSADNIVLNTAGNLIGGVNAFIAINFDGAGAYKFLHMKLCQNTVTTGA